ncbi:MAG: 1-deoxy-D-xylulose-5-phosphate reductoisomerase [Lachnospiraceae bacterium]|nr:1-deoxy-D-xylulose-5-phosphate reductoisomerase [Lachnospiraceae bacterium]
MKQIAVLGSTGSIGSQTLEVVRSNDDMHIVSLAASSNVELLEQQILEFQPEMVCVYREDKAKELKERLKTHSMSGVNPEILTGMDGLVACATHRDVTIVVAAVVGMIGIRPVIEAVKAGKDIAFANKETLVTAGHIIMPLVEKYGVNLLPVDSEHAAIFQCLNGEPHGGLNKILLTASGGPFRGKSREELLHVQVEDALRHPNWSMGQKITIDSSTMVNKGLEVIEARWLFDVDFDQIQVVLQPQSVIHSMVEFQDGAVMAQLGTPDMKLPIQYALCYPERRHLVGERLDFWKMKEITFEKPDAETFRGLTLAYDAGRIGGSMPTVFNAANEKAVALFLERKISYLEITQTIEWCMGEHNNIENPSLEDILEIEQDVYKQITLVKN